MPKKLIVFAVAVAGAVWAWRKTQADAAEQDLWAEATDPVAPRQG
jgi:hypothetical protein